MPRKILIVVDMQNDFITGPLGTPEARAIVPAVVNKIKAHVDASEENVVVLTQDTHAPDYLDTLEGQRLPVKHCIFGSVGWKIIDELPDLAPAHQLFSVAKMTFGHTDWGTDLGKLDQYSFELIGVCTDICVVSNALILRAHYPNAQITVDASCCAGSTPERHKAALDVMRSCQIDVIGDETNA